MSFLELVRFEMEQVFRDTPYAIEHSLLVLRYAEKISECETADPAERERIAIIALLHDIGALEAQRKYGSMKPPYQEREGAVLARTILEKLAHNPSETDRICHIIGNHHTAAAIDGPDFQILWEADLMAAIAGTTNTSERRRLRERLPLEIKTAAGKRIALRYFSD